MNTWVLILSLSIIGTDGRSGAGSSVQSVDGFTSVNACLAAGNQWLKQTKTLSNRRYFTVSARALCVKK